MVESRTTEREVLLCPLARYIYLPKVLAIPKKRWLHPDITEKLFTGTLSKNEMKRNKYKGKGHVFSLFYNYTSQSIKMTM